MRTFILPWLPIYNILTTINMWQKLSFVYQKRLVSMKQNFQIKLFDFSKQNVEHYKEKSFESNYSRCSKHKWTKSFITNIQKSFSFQNSFLILCGCVFYFLWVFVFNEKHSLLYLRLLIQQLEMSNEKNGFFFIFVLGKNFIYFYHLIPC